MAERSDEDTSEDPGRASDVDRSDPHSTPSRSNSRMSSTGSEKNEGKRKKFRPLDAVRKFFKRRPKLKEIDSARARSTSALYGHASEEEEEDDEEGGFLSRISLRKNKSRSEDSVLVEARTNQPGILRKLAYSVEGINKSLYSSNSGKSSSRNSLNSTESQEGLRGRGSSVENAEPSVDLEAVAKTESLNTDAAKFKISVRPKGRKGSQQSRKNRQKVASNLPCLNEEQHISTNPSLNDDQTEEMAPKVETEKSAQKEEVEVEPVAKKKKEPKIPPEELPPKPRPKSTPVAIHTTLDTQQRRNVAMDLESAQGPKYLPNPELIEFAKIRSKSLDIEGRGQRSSDLGLSPIKKPLLVPRSSRNTIETIEKSPRASRKGSEVENLEPAPVDKENYIESLLIEPKMESKNVDLEEKNVNLNESCEKSSDDGLDSQKRPVSPNFGDKSLKPVKSPLTLDLGLTSVQNLDSGEKSPKPLRSPVRNFEVNLRSSKSPIQTPNLESKPFKPQSPTRRTSDLELISSLSIPDSGEVRKPVKSPKTLDLGLRPLRSPVQTPDSPLGVSKPLQSPIKQTQDRELKSPTKSKDSEESIIETSDSHEFIHKLLKSPKREFEQILLDEGHSGISMQGKPTETLAKENQNEEFGSTQLQAPTTEDEDRPRSPKKIIASLELSNLSTKPLRSFSDPKSPRASLRSPKLSPRSPSLPPKPIRSPIESPISGGLDIKSAVKGFELPKLGSRFENTSGSSENLFSKSPRSPTVAPKTFTFMSKPLKSPTGGKSPIDIPALAPKPLKEDSQSANLVELSPNSLRKVSRRPNFEQKIPKSPPDNPSFTDLLQKPLKKVSPEQTSEQKLPKSPSYTCNLEDSSENPLIKSSNLETKSLKSTNFTDSTKDLSSKSTNLESKPLKSPDSEDSNQNPLKRSFEKPSLGPKPLKSPVDPPAVGSKFNLPSNKISKSNKPIETQVEAEDCKSKVGKNLEMFEAIGKKDTKVPLTPKMSTGSKLTTITSAVDPPKVATISSMPEKSKIPDKPIVSASSKTDAGISVVASKTKADNSSKLLESSNIIASPKVVNAFKMADIPNVNDKPKIATGGVKMAESSKIAPGFIKSDKPKIASPSKVSDSSKIAERSKITEGSSVAARSDNLSPKDPKPKPSPSKLTDSFKISESSKMTAMPIKLDSSKHSKETSPDEVSLVATGTKMPVDCPTKVAPETPKPSLAPKQKPFEVTSSSVAANEIAGSGIDVSQNNTNRLSALFEARTSTQVEPGNGGTTVKVEVIAKEDNGGGQQKSVKLREKAKSTEKISELTSRQSKVLDLVKNFQKMQVT